MMSKITVLTCKKYLHPDLSKPYEANIQLEYDLLKKALESKGVTVERINWDDPDYDFSSTDAVVFRTIWDYFERFDEFWPWLLKVKEQTIVINPLPLIEWNIDKHYLKDLSEKGIDIVPTHFVNKNSKQTLQEVCALHSWKKVVIKPAISGAAFHTYKIFENELPKNEQLFKKLVGERDMLVQPFIETITTLGEASLMVFNGTYTYSILKKAKAGDFRVQDDFGGTVHAYEATTAEIIFAEKVFSVCTPVPAYGRVDIVWDAKGNILLSELEIVEPELWVRNHPPAAESFAKGIMQYL